MTDLIDVAFVEARLGVSLNATQATQIDAFIADASAIVLDIGDPTWDPNVTGSEPPATVTAVVFQMVRRAYTNPDGYESEAIGDYRYSRAAETAAGGMVITRHEYKTVKRAAGKSNVTTVGVRRTNDYEREFIRGPYDTTELNL